MMSTVVIKKFKYLDLWNEDTLLVACGDDDVFAINVSVKYTVHEMEHIKDVRCSCVSPNGGVGAFAFAGLRAGIEVHDFSKEKAPLLSTNMRDAPPSMKDEDKTASWVCFSPNGKTILFNWGYKKVYVYRIEDHDDQIRLEKTIKIESVSIRNTMIYLEDKKILTYEKGTMKAHIINIDNEDEFPIVTTSNILKACVVPEPNLFAISTEESINFYNITDGSIFSGYGLSNDEPTTTLLQAMIFTSNG